MSIYLVDYENTKNLSGIKNLSSDDYVIIFYSQKANTLSFDAHKEIISSKAKIEYKLVNVGSQNALDFQLSSYLGYIIGKTENSKRKIYIVSKDKGFSFVVAFWQKELSVKVNILQELNGNMEIAEENTIEKQLKNSDIELNDNEIQEIIMMVKKYKTTQTINGYLNKLFKDSTKAGATLKLIKPFINIK